MPAALPSPTFFELPDVMRREVCKGERCDADDKKYFRSDIHYEPSVNARL